MNLPLKAPKGGADPSAMQVSAVASPEDHVHLGISNLALDG